MSTFSTETNNQTLLPVPPLPDPNAQQNRVPNSTELVTLKRIAESNAKITHMFDKEIEQLRATYETVHKRYLQQQLELEATQSELNRIRSLISATEAQRALRESEQRDILALMHPVRRCPDDILRELFEYITRKTKDRKLALRESVHLSSVCQKWRAVAISTPLLWTKSYFDLRKSPEVLKHQQETVVSRIKGRAADIHVGDIDYLSGELLDACGLKKFPLIELLVLGLARVDGTLQLLRPEFLFPAGRVRKVHIESKKSLAATNTTTHPITVGTSLLKQFPGVTAAVVKGLSNVTIQLTHVNSTLTRLVIDNVGLVLITTVLNGCPKLELLKIRNTTIQGSSRPVTAASLGYLELASVERDTWMDHTNVPKLETLTLFTDSTPTILDFISSSRSIKRLFCRNSPRDIVSIAPQLTELHCLLPLRALYTSSPSSEIALPSLKDLFVNLTPLNHTITGQEFEALVRTRYLRFGHPKSFAQQSSQVISSLVFVLPVNPRPQTWQESYLYKESTRSEYNHPFYDRSVMRLTWPAEKT